VGRGAAFEGYPLDEKERAAGGHFHRRVFPKGERIYQEGEQSQRRFQHHRRRGEVLYALRPVARSCAPGLTTTLQGAEQDARRIEEKSAYGEGMGRRRKAMVKRASHNHGFAMRRPVLFREPRLLPDKASTPKSSATAAILHPAPIFGAGTATVTEMSSMPENVWVLLNTTVSVSLPVPVPPPRNIFHSVDPKFWTVVRNSPSHSMPKKVGVVIVPFGLYQW
jgi:hypothetical protein